MDEFILVLADDVQKLQASIKSGLLFAQKNKNKIFPAIITNVDGIYHDLAIVNDNQTSTVSYQKIVSQDGTIYENGDTVNVYFNNVSPFPKIIGGAGSGGGGGDFIPIIISNLGFVG
jgi:hypothetical protein